MLLHEPFYRPVGNEVQAYRRQVQGDDALYARIIQETGVRLD